MLNIHSVQHLVGRAATTGAIGSVATGHPGRWRLGNSFVLNLGLRYDYYGVVKVYPTTQVPVEIVNFEAATDLTKLDFGPLRDPLEPYNPDGMNFGPRAGFAWTVNGNESTVVRGGVGFLYSPHLIATVRQSAATRSSRSESCTSRTKSISRGVKWPLYTDDMSKFALADAKASDRCSRSSTPT